MKMKVVSCAALLAMSSSFALSSFAYEAVKGRTGVIQWDKAAAFDGYTLLAPAGGNVSKVYLIDNKGWIVKEWDLPGSTGQAEILKSGDLLRLGAATHPNNYVNWGGTAGQINQYDSKGLLKWQYTNVDEDSVLHHTFHQTNDEKTYVTVWQRHSLAEAVAKGRIDDNYLYPLYVEGDEGTTPSTCARGTYCGGLWSDRIVELDKNGQETGWYWDSWDYSAALQAPNVIDINYHIPERQISNRSTADHMHANSVHFDPVNQLLVLCSRSYNEIYLIDYTTKEIVGRWGNPSAYNPSAKKPSWMNDGDTKLWGPHGANFVASSPGSVNVVVFDNGWMRPEDRRSRVFEIQFTKNGGTWTAGTTPVWQYQTVAPNSMLTDFQGFAQRLPNGNTLISSSGQAHLIEVTPTGKVAWEFVSPVFADGAIKCEFSAEEGGPLTFFRAYKYGPDYPGLKKLNLKHRKPFLKACQYRR